jgi:asparagine synthase (glutamine-hydrolysing)
LLRAWEKWGEGALDKIIGDFSFVLWDVHQQTLWCARDFIGARPFYYAYVKGVFCFSNTLEILLQTPEVSADLDDLFIADFLLDGSSLDPAATVYRDIRRLPPAHVLKFTAQRVEVRRFRKLPIEEPLRLKRPEEYIEAYLDLLRIAIGDRLPSGVTSLYLSGGLDSSSVCALTAQIAEAQGRKNNLKAFTWSWEPLIQDLESPIARLTAEHLGIAYEVLQITNIVPLEGADTPDGKTPEPSVELLAAAERRLFRRIAAHSNVVLSGDGGDEVLTGQSWPYLVDLWNKKEWKELLRSFGGYFWSHGRIPPMRGGFRVRIRRLLRAQGAFAEYPSWINDEFASRVKLKQRWLELNDHRKHTEHPWHPVAYDGLNEGCWAPLLEKEDAGWRRVRLQGRAPLLDLRVITFLLRLPPVPWCVNKELGRRGMKAFLPSEVLRRPKTLLPKDLPDVFADYSEWTKDLAQTPSDSMIERFVK